MASLQEPRLLENGNLKGSSKEIRHGRTAHNMSSSSLRKKSDLTLVSKVKCGMLRLLLTNLQEVILGTKLSVLFPAIPLAIAAQCYGFGRPWIFALSLLGLTPLAERISFITEQIAYYTGPTGTDQPLRFLTCLQYMADDLHLDKNCVHGSKYIYTVLISTSNYFN
uniref:Uncharacterized protein n=1 Tax=Populus davidiana TaxID=266767 RepID=A0A6M2EQ84_9ROSI